MKHQPISPEMSIADLMRNWPATIAVFQRHRMACVGCAIAPFNSVAKAAEIYGLPLETFLAELQAAIQKEQLPTGPPSGMGYRFRAQKEGWRLPILMLALLALLAGLWAGLLRLGWFLPALSWRLPAQHGPLMVSGFLGTLITLERAVALSQLQAGRRFYYLAPLLSGAGALTLLTTLPAGIPRGLSTLGALGLVLIFVTICRLQPTTDHLVMGGGALLWLAGSALWLAGRPVSQSVPWWIGFLVLTIAGERLELARILLLNRPVRLAFITIVAALLAGIVLTLVDNDAGWRLSGLALVALGLWLLRFDIARRTIRRAGVTRFIAISLLTGYVWLVGGGLLWLIYGSQATAGPIYDAMLHALFLGFVFSMIFGHAPVIVPALLKTSLSFSAVVYLPLVWLHLSLALRLLSDLHYWAPGRRWGGLLNELALLLFLLVMVLAVRRAGAGRGAS
ncbi:MAG: DUF1858 domain-containing protein [Ardenticatenales bacterium]|nr:DUF1858 domain-containing protein [Ardenticatenales bacterium]